MSFQNILEHTENGILSLTINRPDKLNALNKLTIHELSNALDKAANDTNVKVLILTGAGGKSFVAGADISEFAHFTIDEGALLASDGQMLLFSKIQDYSKPIIAAVNGFALGGGLELAMACHMRVASDTAKMGLPEVSLGVIPGYGGTQRLAQLVGKGKAFEMIMTTDMITADDAFKWGLVNYVTPPEGLLKKCVEIADKIMKRASPASSASAILAINAGFESDKNGFEVEISEFGKCFNTYDFKEGISAFMEKRKPVFLGK